MPADPREAGRKGGSRNTPAQNAARRKNGFQRTQPDPNSTEPDTTPQEQTPEEN